MKRPILITAAAVLIGVLLVGACSPFGPQKDLTRFYVLTSLTDQVPEGLEVRRPGPLAIGIGPVDLAEYLDRPQIQTRLSENEVRFSGVDRWAGPLRDNFARTLTENVAMLLETERMYSHPWYQDASIDYSVRVHVMRFEWNAAGYAELLAAWEIGSADLGTEVEWGLGRFTEPADTVRTDAYVAALSRTLQQFSESIADEIRKLEDARLAAEQEAEAER